MSGQIYTTQNVLQSLLSSKRASGRVHVDTMSFISKLLFDRIKSYDVAFYVLVGLETLALIASTRIKREIKPLPSA